jgi:AmmeMemoRadiSam system protein B
MRERKLVVNGQFYPNNKDELKKYINHFNNVLEQNKIKIDDSLNARAVIVPHAGYIYSGFTANIAYRYIPKNIKNIIVIGPSHKFRFDGASIAMYDKYPTPFGNLDINKDLTKKLLSKYNFLTFDDKVHKEHSTETQFPFIKYYKSDANVIEIIYGNIDFNNLSKTIIELLEDKNNFIVISTDLSHFYNLDEAKKKDNICLNAIEHNDMVKLEFGCEACGKTGIKAMLKTTKILNFNSKILDYRTSANTSNDQNSVVGYASVIFFETVNLTV